MNLPQKITSIVIATGLAVSLASCSTASTEKNDAKPQPSQSASQTPEASKADVAADQKAVAETYKSFLTTLYTNDNTKLQALAEKYKGRTDEPSQAEKDQVISEVEDAVPALKYIDVEGKSADEKQKVYGPIIVLSTLASGKGYSVTVDSSAVNINSSDDKATINISAVTLTKDGKTNTPAKAATDITLVKKNGKWFIEPTDEWLNGSISDSTNK